MAKTVKIGIADFQETGKEFIDAWKRAERGYPPEEPVERLYFADMATLLKTLTQVRWRLLEVLHAEGPSSIRSLSKKLRRDYKNVHSDVGALNQAGLILKDQQNRFTAPWSSIVSEMKLGGHGQKSDAVEHHP